MGLFTKRQLTGQVDKNSLPRHVAVIMDGNGRWAQKRGLPRSAGHKAGAESFRRLGTYCKARVTGFQANVCLNYGGRDEIVHAARAFARDCAVGEKRSDALTEEIFSQYLYSNGLPDPELLIRPGGEKRISNYLLWQCAYSEFYFCDTLWPDFDEREFDKALIAYQHRERRFGGVKP